MLILDYKAMRKLIVAKPFHGQMITVQKVQSTSCIMVTGIELLPKDMISLHFENHRRSGGGEVKSVTVIDKEGCAIVEFKDRQGC